jgi:hypothetical protein
MNTPDKYSVMRGNGKLYILKGSFFNSALENPLISGRLEKVVIVRNEHNVIVSFEDEDEVAAWFAQHTLKVVAAAVE